jgi:hypothetical protein
MPRKKWDKGKVKAAILQRKAEGKDLSDRTVRKDDLALSRATYKNYGSWYKALEAVGICSQDHMRQKPFGYWTKEIVITEIQKMHRNGQTLSVGYVCRKFGPVYYAACKQFRTWQAAIEAAGFDYDGILAQKRWSKGRVIQEIKKRVKNGLQVSSREAMEQDANLYQAGARHFGDWYSAVEAAGFPRSSITKWEKWTRGRILEEIKRLAKEGEDLSLGYNYDNRSRLLASATRYFGTWENAIHEAGFDYSTIRRNRYLESFKGSLFEKYVQKIFVTMKWRVKYHKHLWFEDDLCVPDFIDEVSGAWYDAKINSWAGRIDQTIERYSKYSEKIAIFYLKGKPRKWEDDSVLFVPVTQFYPELTALGAQNLVNDIEQLRRGILNPRLQKQLADFISKQTREEKEIIRRIASRVDDLE